MGLSTGAFLLACKLVVGRIGRTRFVAAIWIDDPLCLHSRMFGAPFFDGQNHAATLRV
jgi:hypothetical protein